MTLNPCEAHALAQDIYRYARRYAIGHSLDPEDALIYDTAVDIIDRECGSDIAKSEATARETRYRNSGSEQIQNSFSLPMTLQDALAALHRLARRYTNGRGTYTAAVVNNCAREMLQHGVSLDQTRALDGTIWAADGANGEHDGLSPEQRIEAVAAIRSTVNHITDAERASVTNDLTPDRASSESTAETASEPDSHENMAPVVGLAASIASVVTPPAVPA